MIDIPQKQTILKVISLIVLAVPVMLIIWAFVVPYLPASFFSQPSRYQFQASGILKPEGYSRWWGCAKSFVDASSELKGNTIFIDIKGIRCKLFFELLGYGAIQSYYIPFYLGDAAILQFKLGNSIDTYTIIKNGHNITVQPMSGKFTYIY